MTTQTNIRFTAQGKTEEVEEGSLLMPKFDDKGLIPAIAQDKEDGVILMFAWMNEEALKKTIELGEAVYFSRSRQKLWHKGATSGQIQTVEDILIDCDQDVVLLKVDQAGGGACHTGRRSCFYRHIDTDVQEGEPVSLEFDGVMGEIINPKH